MHWLWPPQGFDVCQVLPANLLKWADEARWLVGTVIRKMVFRDVDVFGYARLHWKVLHRILTSNWLSKIKKALIDGGVIKTDPYVVEERSTGYRLRDRWLTTRHVRMQVVNPVLCERLSKERRRLEQEQRKRRLPIHDSLDQSQRCLTLTGDADSILDGLEPAARLCQDVLVANIRRGEWRFSVGATGRCFNAITGLKRDLRRSLRIAGEPVGCVDLSCAQPALLALLIGWTSPSAGLKVAEAYKVESVLGPLSPSFRPAPSVPADEVRRFAFLVSGGSFYDDEAVFGGLPRSVVKRGRYR